MVINTSIELLQANILTEYQKEKLQMIEESSKKMENLINELLFLNKNIVSNNIEENIKV
jgi:signal transduction histidine kinase